MNVPYIFDPGQQCARMTGDELLEGLTGSAILICNDYEYELIQQKTGLTEADILGRTGMLIVTLGEHGCRIATTSSHVEVPAVPPHRIEDPTGVGDAFRGGFLKGLAHGVEPLVCARLGSVAATYALEHLGGMSHAYTWKEFQTRYEEHFGPLTLG